MSWNIVKLGDFLKVRENRFKPNDKAISDLKRIDKIDFSGEIFISDKPSNTDMILIKKGDLVISGINVEKGAMAVYTGDEDIIATIHYSSYSFNENEIDIDFLKYFLKSIEFRNALKEQVPGGIKTEIKPKHLLPLLVYIPTNIKDQKAVAKILQNRNSNVDAISTELTHQLELVKKLRQAFLREAMQGKLVKQNPNDETATELLARIKDEKEQLVKEKKIRKQKPLPPIKKEEIPFEIPENWTWCRLGEIVNVKSGKRIHAADYRQSGVPFLRSGEIGSLGRGENLKTELFISKSKYQEVKQKFGIPKAGDILIACIGGSIGNTWIVDEREFYYKDGNLVLIEIIPFLNKHFLLSYLKSPFFWTNTILNATDSSYNALTIVKLNDAEFPLPSLAEQNRIVQKLDKLMQACDALEASIKKSATQNEKLLQQVLREALRKEPVEAL